MKKLNKRIKEKEANIEAYTSCVCPVCRCIGQSHTQFDEKYLTAHNIWINFTK